MRLSLIIPAHNEAGRIGPMLDAYLRFLAGRYGDDIEVIVVINGTTDDTAAVVDRYVARFPQLRCIVEPGRIGKGGALVLGFRQARGELIGFVDADGSTPPEAFQDLVDRIGDADVAVASRWCRGAMVSPRQPLTRRVASRVFNILTRLLFGLRLTDTQCGAKLMKREALFGIIDHLGITRWAFDVDLLYQFARRGDTIVEIPTTWHDVAGSKIQIAAVSAEMLAAIIRLRLVYSPFRWVVGLYESFIAPLIHPEGLERDHLFGHSMTLLACAQAANLGNLLFQAAMMRMLDEVQYGILAAMLGIYAAAIMPLNAVPWAVAHFTAGLLRDGRKSEAVGLARAVTRDVAVGGVAVLAAVLMASAVLADYLKLGGQLPLLLAVLSVVLNIAGSLWIGILQGAQGFVWIGATGVAWSVSRLLLATGAVAVGGAAVGALAGHTVSMLVSAAVALVGARAVVGDLHAPRERVPGFYRYCATYAAAAIGYAVLMNADLVLVKRFFTAEEAGRYAAVAMIGRIILFLPQPIVMAMFPKVSSAGRGNAANWRTLTKALVLACLMLGGMALVCSVFTETVLRVLTGNRSPELVSLVRLMVWGLCPLSLTFFIMNFELAQRRFAVAVPLLACAVGYVACLMQWHDSMQQVVLVLSAAGCLAFLGSIACLPWRQRGVGAEAT